MGIYNNKNHFLHDSLTFIESTGIEGKNGGFNNFLTELKISNSGIDWDKDHSTVDWSQIKNSYQCQFDYVTNNISDFLLNSELSKTAFLYTWLDWKDPIIKVKTIDFIKNWENFYNASIEGMVLVSLDGKLVLEFTDDWKCHLNSNFKIKSTSSK